MLMANKRTMKALTVIFALLFSTGCASHNRARVVQKTEQVESVQTGDAGVVPMSPQQAAQELPERSLVSAIEFEPGRRGLSPEATAEINRAILEASQSGEVDEVNIAVWSDVEAPAGQGQTIPRPQVELAKERGQNIERYIDRMAPAADVKVHNVALEPTSFVQFLQSQEPTVKSQFAALGVSADESTDDLKGRSSSAVVLIKMK